MGQQRRLPPRGEAPPSPLASVHPRNTKPTSSNCRERDSWTTFIDQILDFEAAERHALAARDDPFGRLPRLFAVETTGGGNKSGDRLAAPRDNDLLAPLNPIEQGPEFVLCFEGAYLAHLPITTLGCRLAY